MVACESVHGYSDCPRGLVVIHAFLDQFEWWNCRFLISRHCFATRFQFPDGEFFVPLRAVKSLSSSSVSPVS